MPFAATKFSFLFLGVFYTSNLAICLLHQTWKALPDSHEVAKDLPNALITDVDATLKKLAETNLFFIARRALKDTNQEVELLGLYVSTGLCFLLG